MDAAALPYGDLRPPPHTIPFCSIDQGQDDKKPRKKGKIKRKQEIQISIPVSILV